MLALRDIREWVAGFGISEDSHVYIGKLDNKKERSIGVYRRKGSSPPVMALGALYSPATMSGGSPFWSTGSGIRSVLKRRPWSCLNGSGRSRISRTLRWVIPGSSWYLYRSQSPRM